MDTSKIIGFRHPSQGELLLESLILSRNRLPARARRLTDRGELPAALRRIAIQATRKGKSWSAWADHEIIWFYTAEVTPVHLGGQQCPALKITAYDRKGRVEEHGIWARTRQNEWQRCVRKSSQTPELVAASS